ncbi:MBL fold metallo-hydrolase [Hyphomonas sp. UBA4494]|jgi:ribonuclease Z|uniref:MBL fold metallo-hydrolase n=1 Tax=Hyphomonas sp. UBA4494 TaxID=1946631 RepID=UPI0025C2A3B0|nr:MBL fold metallo-hydrolase [Hyphomonas sp. UBA4494]
MRVLKIILIAATVLVLAVIGARSLFGVQIGEFAFKAAVKSTLGQNALTDAPDGLTVVLVGTGSPLPDPGRVGPMTVVVAGDRVFIVDAGAGSGRRFGELRLPWTNVEAVFLTHFHSDHIDGLGEVMLQHWAAGGAQAPLPINGPDGVGQVVAGFDAAYALDSAYRVAHHGADVLSPSGRGADAVPITPASTARKVYDRDGLNVTAVSVDHDPVEPAVAYRFDYKGRSVTISGDTVKDPRLVALARDTDILVHEALNADMVSQIRDQLNANGQARLAAIMNDILDYHTTPVEGAEVASEAGARMLVFSHFVPAVPSRLLYPAFLKGTDDAYDGPIIMGEDGMAFELSASSEKIVRKRLD